MSWNYRVIRKRFEREEQFTVHEVYYDEDGKPNGYTENEVSPAGSTIEEMMDSFDRYKQAFEKPILDGETMDEVLPPLVNGQATANQVHRDQVADLFLKSPDGKPLVCTSAMDVYEDGTCEFEVGEDKPDGDRWKIRFEIDESINPLQLHSLE